MLLFVTCIKHPDNWQQPQFSEQIERRLQAPGAMECLQQYGYHK
jgi:hypothetical protein